jgi:hypothetical protein
LTNPAVTSVSCSKVAHLLPQGPTGSRTTIEDLRHNTTNPAVPHSNAPSVSIVFTIRDFKSTDGNLRTQAAATMNQHSELLHSLASGVFSAQEIAFVKQWARS